MIICSAANIAALFILPHRNIGHIEKHRFFFMALLLYFSSTLCFYVVFKFRFYCIFLCVLCVLCGLKIKYGLMFQWPFLYHAPLSILDTAHHYKSVRVNFFYLGIQPVQF